MATNVALGSLPWRRANEKLHELDADLVTYGAQGERLICLLSVEECFLLNKF